MFKTIRGRIIFGIGAVSFGILIITNFTIWKVFKENLNRYIINDMDKIKSITYGEMEQLYINDWEKETSDIKDRLIPILGRVNKRYDCYISIDSDESTNIAFTGRLINEELKKNILMDSGGKASMLYTVFDNQGFYATYTYPMFVLNEYRGTLVLQKSYTDEYTNYKKIMAQIAEVEVILYIAALLILYIWLSKVTKSLKDLSRGMELIEEGHYERELEVKDSDEIANLTRHFNRMQSKITKQMEQLYIENKRIEELDRETKNFFNYATHEMKTPITAIKGYGELLEQGGVEEDKQRRIYSRIIMEADRIHNLVQNMLVIARGKEKIEQEAEHFNLRTMIMDMTKELEIALEKEGVHIEVNMMDGEIYAIKEEIGTVFKNLMDNGIKYSSDKRLYIENLDNNPCIIKVRNKCSPIPKKLKEHLMEPFVKYNFGNYEKVSSGLGLFICKELINKNNGKIYYKISEEEICFIVEI